jgi:hypothetical protein
MGTVRRYVATACVALGAWLSWTAVGSSVVPQPGQMQGPPGGIQLVTGYKHERLSSVDTYMGRIWRDDGPELIYEIGMLSMNEIRHYRKANAQSWFRTVGDGTNVSIESIMTDDETLHVAFPGGYSNFQARKLKSKTDVAEILLMLMTFSPGKALKEAGR